MRGVTLVKHGIFSKLCSVGGGRNFHCIPPPGKNICSFYQFLNVYIQWFRYVHSRWLESKRCCFVLLNGASENSQFGYLRNGVLNFVRRSQLNPDRNFWPEDDESPLIRVILTSLYSYFLVES